MTSELWIKVDHKLVTLYRLDDKDECYYAREYKIHGGYGAGEANQLIMNFKKPVDRRGLEEWKYKVLAIKKFAVELAEFIPLNSFVTHVPSSKLLDATDYDDRLEQTIAALQELRPDVSYQKLLRTIKFMEPAHSGGPRNSEALYRNLEWCGVDCECSEVFVIDDVVTSGGHFKACKRMVQDHIDGCRVIGVFWARSIEN